MSTDKQTLIGQFEPAHNSLSAYIFGFVSSLVLSIVAYTIATASAVSNHAAIAIIAVLAIAQCTLQLTIFLHLGREFKPRWKLAIFGLMVTIVIIFVVGSLWIMNNLNYRMLRSPNEMNKYIHSQDGL